MHEELAVRSNANIELFRTDLLKDPSEISCCYIVVVQGKSTEKILLTRMNHVTITPLYYCTIKSLKAQNHFCKNVSLPIYITLYLYLSLSFYLALFLSLSQYLSISLYLYISLYISLSLSPSLYIYLYLTIYPSPSRYIYNRPPGPQSYS